MSTRGEYTIILKKSGNQYVSLCLELIRDILARLGLADVKEFGLSWEDYCEYLRRLGHTATVSISQ